MDAPEESAPVRVPCRYCGELHPEAFSHCPRTGRSLVGGRALVGRIVAGRYRVLALIGEGGMGAVYVAEHLLVGRKVALKRLHPELAGDEKAVARFQREARAAAATGHEHIVEVLDLGFGEDGAPFLVMEYLRGKSVAEVLREEGRLEPRRACRIVGQVLAALSAVHGCGVVHRDLKPDNILLTRHKGDGEFVKVVDFGISKIQEDEADKGMSLTRTGVMLGTPFYMSPEQARGMKDLDHRVDLFGAGVILYEALTGQLPFDGENYHQLLQAILSGRHPSVHSLRPDLPPGLADVVERAIAADPAQRFPDARSMLLALVPFGAEDAPLPASPSDADPRVLAPLGGGPLAPAAASAIVPIVTAASLGSAPLGSASSSGGGASSGAALGNPPTGNASGSASFGGASSANAPSGASFGNAAIGNPLGTVGAASGNASGGGSFGGASSGNAPSNPSGSVGHASSGHASGGVGHASPGNAPFGHPASSVASGNAAAGNAAVGHSPVSGGAVAGAAIASGAAPAFVSAAIPILPVASAPIAGPPAPGVVASGPHGGLGSGSALLDPSDVLLIAEPTSRASTPRVDLSSGDPSKTRNSGPRGFAPMPGSFSANPRRFHAQSADWDERRAEARPPTPARGASRDDAALDTRATPTRDPRLRDEHSELRARAPRDEQSELRARAPRDEHSELRTRPQGEAHTEPRQRPPRDDQSELRVRAPREEAPRPDVTLSQVKGSLVLAAIELVKRHGARAFERILEKTEDDARTRLTSAILPMTWLPLPALVALLRGAERDLGNGDGAFAVRLGRAAADRELTSTHRLFMQSATPTMAVERIPQIFRTYHGPGHVVVYPSTAGAYRSETVQLNPDTLPHALFMSGFYHRLLELSGAREVKVSVVSCRERGDPTTLTILRWR